MGLLSQWYLVSDTILEGWIGFNKTNDVGQYLQSFKRHDNNFWNLDFLDTYMPSQPALLCTATIFGLLSSALLILFLILCATRLAGGRNYRHNKGSSYYSSSSFLSSYFQQKPSWVRSIRGPKQWRISAIGLSCVWLIMFSALFIYVLCLVDFGAKSFDRTEEKIINGNLRGIAGSERLVDRHVFVGQNSVSIHDDGSHSHVLEDQASGDHLLQKFDDIRELGYEYRAMDRETRSLLKYLIFLAGFVFYSATLVVAGLCAVFGVRSALAQKERRSKSMRRYGRVLEWVSTLLLAASPPVTAYTTMLIVHSHAHSSLCPYQQTMVQNGNIEDYVNENFASFEPTSLVDFLADLARERSTINDQNCREGIRPVVGLWLCLLTLAWASLPMAFFTLWLAKKLAKEARKIPPVLSNWANPNTYCAPPNYYHPDQEKSPYTFGTFVYQKKY